MRDESQEINHCICPNPGFCVKYNRQMTSRMHAICQSDSEDAQKFRDLWLRHRPTGAGDVIHSLAKATGLAKVADGVAKALGKTGCGCGKRREALNEKTTRTSPFVVPRNTKPRFVSTGQLVSDTLALASQLPPCITRICGISRSGLTPAALLAKFLHLPLDILRPQEKDIISANNGWRLGQARENDGVTLIVDDTMMMGNSYKVAWPIAEAHYKDPRFAVIYWNPNAHEAPDYYAQELYWPHLLEWNLFNSILTPSSAYDMDGVLCQECPREDNDDGERYLNFLENVRPKYLTRRLPIPLIVTARHEKYREQTLAWLDKWGVQVGKLIMRTEPVSKHFVQQIAEQKASAFKEFRKKKATPGPRMFIESCPLQSKLIAEISGGLVVCPTNGRCFP